MGCMRLWKAMSGWFSKVSQGCRKSGAEKTPSSLSTRIHVPRLYELNTVAYWIMEKNAHSPKLRAQINQIAQVAIELSIKRGATSLTMLKAEERSFENLHSPYTYWTKDLNVRFEEERRTSRPNRIGA